MFDQHLSLKVLLLVVAAFAILAGSLFFILRGRGLEELGTIDMNDARRRELIDLESKRWNP